MSISVSPAASVAFEAKHWLNSFYLGIEQPMMAEMGALVGEFVGTAEEVPERQREIASSIWGAVLESSYPDLLERFFSDRQHVPQHRTSDGWKMDLVVDEDLKREVPKGLGVVVRRSVVMFPAEGGEMELVSRPLSREQVFRRDGTRASQLFIWTRPEMRKQGIATEVLRRYERTTTRGMPMLLVDGSEFSLAS